MLTITATTKRPYETGDLWLSRTMLVQKNLGWMHQHGLGVAQSYREAERRHRRAAEQGYGCAQLLSIVMGVDWANVDILVASGLENSTLLDFFNCSHASKSQAMYAPFL